VSSGSEAEAGVAEPWFYSAPPIKFKPILNTYDNFPISFFPQNTLRSQIKRLPPLNTTIFNIRAYANMATMNMRDTKRFRLLEVQDLMAYNRSMESALPSPTPSLLDSLNSLPNELKLMILRQFFVPRVLTADSTFAKTRSDLENPAAVNKSLRALAMPTPVSPLPRLNFRSSLKEPLHRPQTPSPPQP
jgi:hypothetical protein